MKYLVNVSDENDLCKDYIISLKNQRECNNSLRQYQSDSNMVIEISRTEYEHCIKRLDRLDNKVYIMLTVCAFIFVMLTGALSNIDKIKLPNMISEWLMIITYGAILGYACWLTVNLLFKLINVLSSVKMSRLDSADVSEYNMILSPQRQVARYVIGIYEQATFQNNRLIDKKYIELDACVKLLTKTILVLLAITFIGAFEPKAATGDKKLSEVVFIIINFFESILR